MNRPSTGRVGFFGLLGSGNLGNDASFETVLGYLRRAHPDVALDAMCMGPETVRTRYGIDAVPLQWSRRYEKRLPRPAALAVKIVGKAIDPFRTLRWVRRHDAIVVPGMGILEASLPIRATGVPYALFLLALAGKLCGTKVALVSVGAGPIHQRGVRTLFDWATRMVTYRSYRDRASRDAVRARGIDTSADAVYPDLVFGLDVTETPAGEAKTTAVGVMDYHGDNADRHRSDEIYRQYTDVMTTFTATLLERGHRVLLFWGDPADEPVAREIVRAVRVSRPGLDPTRLAARPCPTLRQVMAEMAPASAVVATRYHTVLSGLKLAKPTIALGYSTKHDSLMADMGMVEFSLSARTADHAELLEAFDALERRSDHIRNTLISRNVEKSAAVGDQLSSLSSLLDLTPLAVVL